MVTNLDTFYSVLQFGKIIKDVQSIAIQKGDGCNLIINLRYMIDSDRVTDNSIIFTQPLNSTVIYQAPNCTEVFSQSFMKINLHSPLPQKYKMAEVCMLYTVYITIKMALLKSGEVL